MDEKVTRGVRILRGDPKKAVVKLSIPMIIGMMVQTIYNLADGIWVAGLGTDALAAIGLFFPIFMGIMSIASGLGVGASSAIARRVGAKDKRGADNVAIHTILLTIILSVVIMAIVIPTLKNIFGGMGAGGRSVELAITYANILLMGTVVMIFNNAGTGILRGEGDTKRTMYAMVLGSGLNIILDPIFIYSLDLGVAGAAYATLLSMLVTSILIQYWLFVKKDTYIDINFRDFSPSKEIIKDILRVGVPASLSQLTMSIAMFFLNAIIIMVGGKDGVAVFTSAWRITMVGLVPLLGIASATTAVTGSAYGEKNIEKLKLAYLHAIKIGIFVEILFISFVEIFANYIATLFTYSEASTVILNPLVSALRILVIFLIFTPLGMMSSAMFQGIGEGEKSLVLTILRTVVMQILFAYIFAIYIEYNLMGVWLGIIMGNIFASFIGFSWGRIVIGKLYRKFSSNT